MDRDWQRDFMKKAARRTASHATHRDGVRTRRQARAERRSWRAPLRSMMGDLERRPGLRKAIAGLLIMLGILFGVLSVASWTGSASVALFGTETRGEIVDVLRFGEHDRRDPRPVLRFLDEGGRSVVATSVTGVWGFDGELGDAMTLRYDPDDPEKMVAGSPVWALFNFFLLLVFSIYAFVTGAKWLGRGRRRRD
jgi:hypothetical protein